MLVGLGYTVPKVNFTQPNYWSPSKRAPSCDNTWQFEHLETPRIGMVGWSSWGFAYDTQEDCAPAQFEGTFGQRGFRQIAGHSVSCVNAWQCEAVWMGSTEIVRLSDVAADTRGADIVMISNWMNDSKMHFGLYRCFKGEQLDPIETADLTIDSLRRLIRAIRSSNPAVVILVVARYPDPAGTRVGESSLDWVGELNARVRAAVESERDTFFVDYTFPNGEDMFQLRNAGHPNCRGDRVIATNALRLLYANRILARGLALPTGSQADECLGMTSCEAIMTKMCCQRAAMCHLDETGSCVPYRPEA